MSGLDERLREFVGVAVSPPQTGPDPVNEPMIRHWCEAMGDENPIYADRVAARASGHGGIVAPPTMLQAWTMRGLRLPQPGAPRDKLNELLDLLSEAGFDSIVATDCEQEYVRYLRPGDRITATEVIESISEQKATALGAGHFIDTRITFRDQDGEIVGSQHFRLLKFRAPSRTADAPALEKPRRLRPTINEDNAFFWEGVERGELLLQRCESCGALRHPPRPMCPHCQSLDWEATRACGRGTIYSYAVTHYPEFPPFEYPFATAIVELEEGARIVSNLVDADLDKLSVGMPVEVVFREVEEGLALPLFRPVVSRG
jgi:uncharacterized OB-fold protein/acyl dehydratase